MQLLCKARQQLQSICSAFGAGALLTQRLQQACSLMLLNAPQKMSATGHKSCFYDRTSTVMEPKCRRNVKIAQDN